MSIPVIGSSESPPHDYFLSEVKLLSAECPSPPAEPAVPVKTKPPSPPASSSISAGLGGDVTPSATSSPREEPNGLEDSVNGAPVKRPHSPTEEEMAKRHKEAEVSSACRTWTNPESLGSDWKF